MGRLLDNDSVAISWCYIVLDITRELSPFLQGSRWFGRKNVLLRRTLVVSKCILYAVYNIPVPS